MRRKGELNHACNPIVNGEKLCTKCNRMIPVSGFRRRNDNFTGLMSWCKECKRTLSDKPLAKKRGFRRDSFVVDEQKTKAKTAVNNALSRGKLKKPSKCERCGQETESSRLHGHHHDYDKVLDVTWLCVSCHAQEHYKPRSTNVSRRLDERRESIAEQFN